MRPAPRATCEVLFSPACSITQAASRLIGSGSRNFRSGWSSWISQSAGLTPSAFTVMTNPRA
ncbi:MAG: hypothetical protein L0K12_00005, partial [Brevibacterium aurantiacum]|nr:hypothetical protein [Brevibacterium aurantiacum]